MIIPSFYFKKEVANTWDTSDTEKNLRFANWSYVDLQHYKVLDLLAEMQMRDTLYFKEANYFNYHAFWMIKNKDDIFPEYLVFVEFIKKYRPDYIFKIFQIDDYFLIKDGKILVYYIPNKRNPKEYIIREDTLEYIKEQFIEINTALDWGDYVPISQNVFSVRG